MRQSSERKEKQQDKVVFEFMKSLDTYFSGISEDVLKYISRTREAPKIDASYLSPVNTLMEEFFVNIVHEGIKSAKADAPMKRLAALPKGKLPKDMKAFEDLFKDKAEFRRFIRRADKLSRGLQKEYLRKLRKKFTEIVPAVLANEITPKDALVGIQEAWGATRSRAKTIFQTDATNYFADTQIAYYKDEPEIIGFLFDSIRDGARTAICASRHGFVFRPDSKELKENKPGCHYNCRSHLIPLADTPQNRKLLNDPRRDPSKATFVPLPPGWRS